MTAADKALVIGTGAFLAAGAVFCLAWGMTL